MWRRAVSRWAKLMQDASQSAEGIRCRCAHGQYPMPPHICLDVWACLNLEKWMDSHQR